MAKYCAVCGKKIGFLEGKVAVSDGIVCSSCWASAGMDMGFKCMLTAAKRTVPELKSLIGLGVARREAEKDGMTKLSAARVIHERQAGHKQEPAKPVDFIITVDSRNVVGFQCKGHPVINFEDMIHEKEMIIGDGYMHNESGRDLPELRIICEFDPPIIDPGQIYYEAGTFTAGANGKFEIDDPPVNFEKYAEITENRSGTVKFTLYLGEQKLQSQECGLEIEATPKEEMEKLIKAVTYEEEKNAPGPVNIFLYAKNGGSYEMDLMRNPQLLYSMYSNDQEQLIGDAFVSNDTPKVLKKVKVDVKFTSDILSPVSVLLGDVPPGKKIDFEIDDPGIDVEKLQALTEIETCTATYSLSVAGKIVVEMTGKITICPYDQWNAALILLPAYMTPNHPNVLKVLQNASKWMLVNGMNPSLEGYQGDGKRVEEMVKAVYNSVKEANIIYSNPPASFFGPQRIRLCGTVLEQKFATCLDMTILFASCLESFGLHPVLITAPGHIFAGVWLSDTDRLQEPIISDAKKIQKYIKDGRLIALECTAMNAGENVDYEDAKKVSNKLIDAIVEKNVEDHECIDVQLVRKIGVRPLPIRVSRAAQKTEPVRQEADEPGKAEESKALKVPRSGAAAEPAPVPAQEIPDQKPAAEPVHYCVEPYKSFAEDLSHISMENFYNKESKQFIQKAIAEIVETEGPISQPSLIRVLVNATSLGRTGKQISEYLDKLAAGANVKITRQNGVRFLWPQDSVPDEYTVYRTQEQRDLENICKYEMKNAVCWLIQEHGPMTKDEIDKELVNLFGYNRTGRKVEEGAAEALRAARGLKAVEQNENRKFVLVNGK